MIYTHYRRKGFDMGIWSETIKRSQTGEHRRETIGGVISACNKIRDFINLLCEKKLGYSYSVCEYEMSGEHVNFRFDTRSGEMEVSIKYSPNDFDYSMYMYLKQKMGFIEDCDKTLLHISKKMSDNMSRYLMTTLLVNPEDYSVLFEI